MMNVDDEAQLERLRWVVYDGVLLPGDMSPLSGQHLLDRILNGAYKLIFRGEQDSQHCPTCTISLANAEQTLRKARQPCTPSVKSTVQVAPKAMSSYQNEGSMAASLTTLWRRLGTTPFTSIIQRKWNLKMLNRL